MTGWDIVDLDPLEDEYFILIANKARGEYVICNPTGSAGLYGNTVPSHGR